GVVATPFWTACLEKPFRLPSSLRGTPSPAESLRKTNDPRGSSPECTNTARFTLTVVGPPMRGGCGTTGSRRGPLIPLTGAVVAADAILWRPIHAPPGAHPQPEPWQKDHDP